MPGLKAPARRGAGRELTPRQHAAIRRQIALIPVYIWLFYSWTHLLVTIPSSDPVRDFAHFYAQGIVASEGNTHALYDRDEQAAIIKRRVPSSTVKFPTVYGPQVALFFRPLAGLSYLIALEVWLAVSIAIYAACCYAIWRVCPRLHDHPWTTAVLLIAAPAFHFALGFAQVSAIGLLCVTAGFLALRARRPLLAGLAIGSLAYKPPLGLAVAFVFVCAGEWRIVTGAIAAAAAQLTVGALYWGPAVLPTYVRALRQIPSVAAEMEPFTFHIHSWRSFFQLLHLPPEAAMAAYAIASVVTLTAALVVWRTGAPIALRYSMLLLATVLVDPHIYAYDLILLTPAFLLLWDWVLGIADRPLASVFPQVPFDGLRRRSFRTAFEWLLYACYFAPAYSAISLTIGIQPSVVALALMGLVLTGLVISDREHGLHAW